MTKYQSSTLKNSMSLHSLFTVFRVRNLKFGIRNCTSAFTLIESLAVVSIIGVLATTAIYTYASMTLRSRDARRKSDLTAISLGFQARHDSQTCSNAADLGYYPGRTLDWSRTPWPSIAVLRGLNNDCGAFSEFLSVVPTDPRESNGGPAYRFNLSNKDGVIGRHYRLTAKLEKTLNASEQNGLARANYLWQNAFGGATLPTQPVAYNYLVGN